MPSALKALHIRDFRLFTLGNFMQLLGFQMVEVTLGWELYERTHSAAALGFVGLANIVPVIALALISGHVSDHFNRRNILVAALSLLLVVFTGFAALSYYQASIYWYYALMVLAGISRSFNSPARSALMSLLVPSELMSNAVTWNSNFFQTAVTLGPMIGGFLIATTHNYPLVYALGAFAVASFIVMLLQIPMKGRDTPQIQGSGRNMSLRNLLSGISFVWQTKLILSAITLDLFAVLFGGATALLPIFAKDILHTNSMDIGWLRAAPALGALTVGMTLALIPAHLSPLRKAGRSLIWCVAGFGMATICFGLSRSFWLSMAALFLTGAFDSISVIVRMTLVQLLTPNEMRGRVSAVNYVFIGSSNELGAFESGITAAAFGPIVSVVAGGCITIVVVVAAALQWPELRKLKSLDSLVKGNK